MKGTVLVVVALLLAVAFAKNSIHVVDPQDENVAAPEYMIGVAKSDVTGPASGIGMMGYALPFQNTAGIHTRLWARAYVVSHPTTGGLVAFVNVDVCMIFQAVKLTVIAELQEIFGPTLFTNDNVLLTGIHTHSGPGGFSWYIIYDISDFGYCHENFRAIVDGIVDAIVKAHSNMQPGNILVNPDNFLNNTNINRSPTAYLANPIQERNQYFEGDTDKNMTLVKMVNANGDGLGSIAWFPVHCTSMNNTNHYISSDNKGYASYLFEKQMAPNSSVLFPDIPFVASFAQANEGDVSPNTRGAHCPDGSRCADDSTCNGKNEHCIASGPGVDMFDSTKIIGTSQYKKASEIYESAKTAVTGPISYRHVFVNMTDFVVSGNFTHNGAPNTTCRAAMGYSFAAGTTDGPGAFDFTQGDNDTQGNPFWNFVKGFIAKPTKDQIECQSPKPILLDVGLTKPNPWAPDVVSCQLFAIGQLVIVAIPGELTTMAGRRLRNTVREIFVKGGMKDPVVIISGLSNTYTGYVATFQEYEVQRYEGASTIFGPHTLGAYQTIYSQLANAILTNTPAPASAVPRNLSSNQISFIPPVVYDAAPIGKKFGSIYKDVLPAYKVGQEASVIFHGGELRNDLMTGKTYLLVEQLIASTNEWKTILTDADWDTKLYWEHVDVAESQVTVMWNITAAVDGKYRLTHLGYAKESPLSSKLTAYTGTSSVFAVTN